MKIQRFKGSVAAGPRGSGLIVIPFDPDQAWGAKSQHRVGGRVNGRRVRGSITPGGGGWAFTLTPMWLRDAGVAVGDEVAAELAPEGPQRDDLADDVRAALEANPAAGAFFDTLAQFYRKAYLRWIDATTRRPDVRAARIAEVVDLLAAGVKERPRLPRAWGVRARGSGSLGGMKLHVGCAMWTYTPWRGRYLPQSLSPRDRLSAYATWCNAVEGNTTFYATPAIGTVKSWAEQTGPDFRFILKLPKAITHERHLTDVDEPLRDFLAAIEPLGSRAHALWIQLPPSFGPDGLGTLAGFLRRLPREYRYCVEVRHRAFFEHARSEQLLEQALGAVDAEWVTFDTTVLFSDPPATDAEREAWTKKPRLPRRTRALTSSPVVRYIGRDDAVRTAAGWGQWADTVGGWLREGRSPTVFIHAPDNVAALELARRFHDDVRARVPGVEPLPEPIPAAPPTLF